MRVHWSPTYHSEAVAFFASLRDPLVTNMVVIAEVTALLAQRFQADFLDWATGALEIDE